MASLLIASGLFIPLLSGLGSPGLCSVRGLLVGLDR